MRDESSTMTVRMDRRTKDRLEKLSRATARTKSFLAAEAIKSYLEQNEWQIRAIREGAAAADAGNLVLHDEVANWLATWGDDDESEPPR